MFTSSIKTAAVTGHTSGIGLAIFNYLSLNYSTVQGFSRTNGYDISNPQDRDRILSALESASIFVNNAYNNFDDSQLQLLIAVYDLWKGTDRIVVNVSSRYTQGSDQYCAHKEQQDIFCRSKEYTLPYIINLKPGLVDTPRVKQVSGNRLNTDNVVAVLDFSLHCGHKVHSITFGI